MYFGGPSHVAGVFALNIVAAVQSQLLQTLLAALDVSGLADGATTSAKVIAVSPGGLAMLELGGRQGTIALGGLEALARPLLPGSIVSVTVDRSQLEPKLILVGVEPPATGAAATTLDAPLALALGRTDAANDAATVLRALPPDVASKAGEFLSRPDPRAVLLQSKIGAVLNQNGLGPLLADLEAMLSAPSAAELAEAQAGGTIPLQARPLPAPLFKAMVAVMRQQLDAGMPLDQDDIRQALLRSGLFLEAKLARGQAPSPGTDLKAALLALKQTAGLFVGIDDASPDRRQAAASLRSDAPAAPRRDTAPEPQRASPSELGARLLTRDAIALIAAHAGEALDRLKLLQFASLSPSSNPTETQRTAQQVWAFEMPFHLRGETGVAALRIEHERQGRKGAAAQPLWRVEFGIATSDLGALHGSLALRGAKLSLALFAERRETAEEIRQAAPDLHASLQDSQFDLVEFSVLTGRPAQAAPRPGYFVDNAA